MSISTNISDYNSSLIYESASEILTQKEKTYAVKQAINNRSYISTVLKLILLHTFTWSGCLSANEANSEHHCDIMSNAGTGQLRQEALVNWSDDWKDGNRPRQLARTVNSSSSFWYKTRSF